MANIKHNTSIIKRSYNFFTLIIITTLFLSCTEKNQTSNKTIETIVTEKSELEIGKELFNNKGKCLSCHQPNQKIIGPSIETIVQIYQEKNGDMIAFLKGDAEPIVDPTQYEIMKANLEITKTMSNEELKAIVNYMNSFLK